MLLKKQSDFFLKTTAFTHTMYFFSIRRNGTEPRMEHVVPQCLTSQQMFCMTQLTG